MEIVELFHSSNRVRDTVLSHFSLASTCSLSSRSTKHRDWNIKRDKYWETGVKEYWIVDPEKKQITILIRGVNQFEEHQILNLQKGEIQSVTYPELKFKLDNI